jgi:biopolymer transport protein ExbB
MHSPLLANVVVDLFIEGGPIMYPILLAALATVAVVGERIVWWWRFNSRRDPKRLAQVFAALEEGSIEAAQQTCRGSQDPVIRMLDEGLRGYPRSVEENLQVVAMDEVEHAGKYLSVMDTLITLAPLLGLLGTVTGIMGSFQSIGGSELAVEKVTGGIGEALIATAAGLGIAIIALLPYNHFTRRAQRLEIELQKAGTLCQGLLKRLDPRPSDDTANYPSSAGERR